MKPPSFICSTVRRLAPGLALLLAFGSVAATRLEPMPPSSAQLSALTAPLYFEPVSGAESDVIRFVARSRGCNVWLAPNEAWIAVGQAFESDRTVPAQRTPRPDRSAMQTRTVRLVLQGANVDAAMTGLEKLPGKANYFVGNDPAAWRTGIALFSRIQVDEVYPGIRVIYYADESARLEYDFLLQPGARPDRISFRVEGADRVRVDADGDLVLTIGDEQIRQHRPVIYQEIDGQRKPVAGGYRLAGDTIGFWIGDYDRNQRLVIDPVLSFSTYLGRSKADVAWSVARDAAGDIYVAGETLSKGMPGTNGVIQPNYAGGHNIFGDAFVAKYNSVSNQLVYLTYLGGKGDDGALAVAVDGGGNAFVTGFTDSRSFPIVPTNAAIRNFLTGTSNNAFRLPPVDAFVAEIDPSGTALVFSTLLGGTRRDSGTAIAVDGSGVYVAGYTESTNFIPVPAGFQPIAGGNGDAFIVKLVGGTTTIYASYLGGTNFDTAEGIAVDPAGNAYVTGFTFSTNFPILNPIAITNSVFTNGIALNRLNVQTNRSTASDGYIASIAASGAALNYSTYLGGSNSDACLGIAVDGSGNAYVTGYTFSKVFPTNIVTLPRTTFTNFESRIFVTKVDPGDNLVYSTQFGSTGSDQGTAIAVDSAGNAYVTGYTSTTNFFGTNSFTNFRAATTNSAGKRIKVTGPNDGFVAVLDPAGANFLHSIYLGGAGSDQPNSIAVDPSGASAVVVGSTFSANLPTTNILANTLVQTNLGAVKNSKVTDAFIEKILFP